VYILEEGRGRGEGVGGEGLCLLEAYFQKDWKVEELP